MLNDIKIVILAPALNEEKLISSFIESVLIQSLKPDEIIIVDNGSNDKTSAIASSFGCTVLFCQEKGVSFARSFGINYLLEKYKGFLNNLIIVQLDCDQIITNTSFLYKVKESYSQDRKLMVTVGPIEYNIPFGGNIEIVDTGKKFRNIFGVKKLEDLFLEAGRNIKDYLISSDSYKMFTGGNTTYRACVFTFKNVQFPQENCWESLVISVRIQQHLSSEQFKFIKEQSVSTSCRAITGLDNILTEDGLSLIKHNGYIMPYKDPNTLPPLHTLKKLINSIDRETYNLSEEECIESIISFADKPVKPYNLRFLPMKHASTLEEISGKFVLIKNRAE